jgi:hypothetical protein
MKKSAILWCLLFSVMVVAGAEAKRPRQKMPKNSIATAIPYMTGTDSSGGEADFSKNLTFRRLSPDFNYFVVPQGAEFKFQVVWDPFDHNGRLEIRKYHWADKHAARKKDAYFNWVDGNLFSDPACVAEHAAELAPYYDKKDKDKAWHPSANRRCYFTLSSMVRFFKNRLNSSDSNRELLKDLREEMLEDLQEHLDPTQKLKVKDFLPDTSGVGPGKIIYDLFVDEGEECSILKIIDRNNAPKDAQESEDGKAYRKASMLAKYNDMPKDRWDYSAPPAIGLPNDLNKKLPNDTDLFEKNKTCVVPYTPSSGSHKNHEHRIIYSYATGTSGLYLGNLAIARKQKAGEDAPEFEDYRVYIEKADDGVNYPLKSYYPHNPQTWNDPLGIPVVTINSGEGGGNKVNGESCFFTRFDVPTLGADGEGTLLAGKGFNKIRVYGPGAEYAFKKIWWCWEEIKQEYCKKMVDSDGDGTEDTETWEEIKKEDIYCSVDLHISAERPGPVSGFTGIQVFDCQPPIVSDLEIPLPSGKVSHGSCGGLFGDNGALDFTLRVIDNNPNGNSVVGLFRAKFDGDEKEISQDPKNIRDGLKIFYSYPVYDFKVKSNIRLPDLEHADKSNVGLLNFAVADTPVFEGLYFEPKWVWKEAEILDRDTLTITNEPLKADPDATYPPIPNSGGAHPDLIGGIVYTISGKFRIPQAAPWHFANVCADEANIDAISKIYSVVSESGEARYPTNDEAPDKTKPEQLIKVFAVVTDSMSANAFNNKCTGYSSFVKEDGTLNFNPSVANLSAGQSLTDAVDFTQPTPTPLKTAITNKPPLLASIQDKLGDKFANLGTDEAPELLWQKYAHLKVEDKVPPEIQVLIFDTRTNRIHNFANPTVGDSKLVLQAQDGNELLPGFKKKMALAGLDHQSFSYLFTSQSAIPYSTTDAENLTKQEFSDGKVHSGLELELFNAFADEFKSGGVNMLSPENTFKRFVCQKNTRLVFFIRAWDNLNTFSTTGKMGVKTISYQIVDNASVLTANPYSEPISMDYDPGELYRQPPFRNFSGPNCFKDTDGKYYLDTGKECAVVIKATDFGGNEAVMKIELGILDSDMTVRSLEERRFRQQ